MGLARSNRDLSETFLQPSGIFDRLSPQEDTGICEITLKMPGF